MQLRHIQTVLGASDGAARITAFAFSPNNAKLAVVSTDRVGDVMVYGHIVLLSTAALLSCLSLRYRVLCILGIVDSLHPSSSSSSDWTYMSEARLECD